MVYPDAQVEKEEYQGQTNEKADNKRIEQMLSILELESRLQD